MLALNTIHCLDALKGLKQLDDQSVDCVVTSPPYWAMRDYQIPPTTWSDESKSILGLERSCTDYVNHLLEILDEVKRVLKDTGTCWLNIGDTYVGSWGNYAPGRPEETSRRHFEDGSTWHRPGSPDATFRPPSSRKQDVPSRCLALIPERIALAMVDRGWILRNRICWHKPNGLPESVKNRLRSSWEYVLFFTKTKTGYYFDLDAIREPHKSLEGRKQGKTVTPVNRHSQSLKGRRLPPRADEHHGLHRRGKNPGDYWTFAVATHRQGPIFGSSGAVHVPGGSGWTGHRPGGQARMVRELDPRWLPPEGKNPGDAWEIATQSIGRGHYAVYPERLCERPIKAGCPPEGLVLDPFMGSGTTAVVATQLGRKFIGFELNPDYIKQAEKRIAEGKSIPVEQKGGVRPPSSGDGGT